VSCHPLPDRLRVAGRELECRWYPADADRSGGTGPPLVLLHEGLGCVELWRDTPERLAAATARPVLTYSRMSYGRSEAGPLPRGVGYLEEEADLLAPVLDAAGLERAVLVGHSDGASIALAASAADATRERGARRVAGVVAISPHVTCEPSNVEAIRAAGARYQQGELRIRLARYHADVDAAFHTWYDAWTDPAFAAWSIVDRLAAIAVPVLAVQGDADPYGSADQLALIEAYVDTTTVLEVPGAQHDPHREAAELVIPAIADFVRQLR